MGKNLENKLIIYQHEELIVAGITGIMEMPLSNAAFLIESYYDIEVAPVQCQLGRDFLAMFAGNPPRDITIDQVSQSENAIVGFALNKKKLTETIEQIAKTIGFEPHHMLDYKEAKTWETEFELEKITYKYCEKISSAFQKPLESVFGMVRYANFLGEYKGTEEKEATEIAARKFGIPILPQ